MSSKDNIIFSKIQKLSQNRKFAGLSFFNISTIFSDISKTDLGESLSILQNKNKIIIIGNKFFPKDWEPKYTEHETKIISFLTPYFDSGRVINLISLKNDIGLINRESLDIILSKLELQKKIIMNTDKLFYSFDFFLNNIKLIKDLNRFTITDFKKLSGLPSKVSEMFLSFLDRLRITNFDGRSRTINSEILIEYL